MKKEYRLDKNVRALLKDCHMSQGELATEIGTSEGVVNKWLNNKSFPSMLMLMQLADYFCLTLDELVYGDIEA